MHCQPVVPETACTAPCCLLKARFALSVPARFPWQIVAMVTQPAVGVAVERRCSLESWLFRQRSLVFVETASCRSAVPKRCACADGRLASQTPLESIFISACCQGNSSHDNSCPSDDPVPRKSEDTRGVPTGLLGPRFHVSLRLYGTALSRCRLWQPNTALTGASTLALVTMAMLSPEFLSLRMPIIVAMETM